LFPCPELEPFNEYDLTPLCNEFHAQFNSEVPPGLMATFNPVYYHADRWVLKGNMLLRLRLRATKTFFVPNGTQDRPVPVEDLAPRRVTEMELADGTKRTFTDNRRRSDDPCARVDAFKGRTIFLLASKPTGRRASMKTSTVPQSLSESKEATETIEKRVDSSSRLSSSSRPSKPLSAEDTFVTKLDKTMEGTLEDFKALDLQAVSDIDPATSQLYVHDWWFGFPAPYVRAHHEKHRTLYVPPEDHGFASHDIEEARMTLIIDDDGVTPWVHDNWHEPGELEVDRAFVGATCFCKVD